MCLLLEKVFSLSRLRLSLSITQFSQAGWNRVLIDTIVLRFMIFYMSDVFLIDELGDYDREIHSENYVSSLKLALRQNLELEKKVMELHRKREPGLDIAAVYDEFIIIARGLETYGIDPHPVKDYRGTQLYVGISFSGISTFSVGKRIQHFRWPEISKINYEGKMFIIHLTYTVDREVKKHTVGFKCQNSMTCRYVWRCAIEQMFFFT